VILAFTATAVVQSLLPPLFVAIPSAAKLGLVAAQVTGGALLVLGAFPRERPWGVFRLMPTILVVTGLILSICFSPWMPAVVMEAAALYLCFVAVLLASALGVAVILSIPVLIVFIVIREISRSLVWGKPRPR
jgi:hypothetical protein